MHALRVPRVAAPVAQSRNHISPPTGAADRGRRSKYESPTRGKDWTASASSQKQPRTRPMATGFIKLHPFPNGIAVTKIDAVVTNGAFLLDFSRPLQHVRWLVILNPWLGITVGLFVPVIHQREEVGSFVIAVKRSDPSFEDVITLWGSRYLSTTTSPSTVANGLQVIADFHKQFPEDTAFYS